jgi:cell division septum initiation protein DivIVA
VNLVLQYLSYVLNRYNVKRTKRFSEYQRSDTDMWINDVVQEVMGLSDEEDKQEDRLTALVRFSKYISFVFA